MTTITADTLHASAEDRERFREWFRTGGGERTRQLTGHFDDVPNSNDAQWWVDFESHGPACYSEALRLFNEDNSEPTPVQVTAIIPEPQETTITIPWSEYDRLTHEATREFTEYDPRMLPMVRKLGRAATLADFCHEYDRLMDVVNAPARDEILAREYDIQVEVEIRNTVMVIVSSSGVDADDAWENIDMDQIRQALGDGDVEYDDILNTSMSDYATGDFVDI